MRFWFISLNLSLLLFISAECVHSMQLPHGMPHIQNIKPETYGGGIQNWHAIQTPDGLMYIANQEGVFEYDGVNWRTIEVPNTSVLSLDVYHDTLFVGGANEIGFIGENTENYYSVYHSLTHLIPEKYREFGNVWQVLKTEDDGIYFRTAKHLLRYRNGKFKVWETDLKFHFAFIVQRTLYINITGKGLHRLKEGKLRLINNGQVFAQDGIYAMLPYEDDTMLMATRFKNLILFDGETIRPFESPANNFLEKNRLYTGLRLQDGSYLFGTLLGGLIHINKRGKILNIINKEKGLISNVVYHLFQDDEGNVWSSQNHGISLVHLQSPVTIFDQRSGLNGMALAAIKESDIFYIGTDQGLFVSKEAQNKNLFFRAIENFNRSPYDFIAYREGVLVAATNGIWWAKGTAVSKLLDLDHVQCITRTKENKDIFYLGTQGGIYVAKANGNKLALLGKIRGIDVGVTTLETDQRGDLWAGSPANGLYQIKWTGNEVGNTLNPKIVKWANEKERTKVFKAKNKVFFGFKDSFMTYSHQTDSLTNTTFLNDHSETVNTNPGVFLLAEDRSGNIWVRSDEKNQHASINENGSYTVESRNLNLIKSEQLNFIYPDQQGIIWYGVAEGMLRYNPYKTSNYKKEYSTFVREILVRNDSLIYTGPSAKENADFALEYADNELRFRYAAPTFTYSEDTQYQVWLKGFDDGWSDWTSETQKDYTNIPEGSYTFHVRAQNIYDQVSQADTFSFSIAPPWYRTIWAYLMYVLVVGSTIYGVYRFRINNILREQRVRNRIASDLHDEVSATLSSISYFAQAIQQSSDRHKEKRFIKLISESAGDAKEKITDIIWSIDPENDDWVNLLSKCRRFASDLLESKSINYEMEIDESINRPLDVQLRQHLWLIFKEMVTNVARHSGATKADIRLTFSGGVLTMLVQDNGTGFNAEQLKEGHGVTNIRKRVLNISGDLTLESDQNLGTRWILKVKL